MLSRMLDPEPTDLRRTASGAFSEFEKPIATYHADTSSPKGRSGFGRALLLIALIATACVGAYAWSVSRAPAIAPHAFVEIPEGAGTIEIAETLSEHGVVRDPFALIVLLRAMRADRAILSGAYLFDEPEPLSRIAERLRDNIRGIATIKVTFPEGIDIRKIATIAEEELPNVHSAEIIALAKGREGYLFPDTYFWFSTATSGEVVAEMLANGEAKTTALREEAKQLSKDWDDAIILASIIEREVRTPEDRRLVAGILERRMAIGMALQVDATFAYTIGKTSAELTIDDLKSDDPYNTYTHRGLPPGPIGNPGLDAIDAALHPVKSPYLYYLSDEEGTTRFAKTFDEHKMNKQRYLR